MNRIRYRAELRTPLDEPFAEVSRLLNLDYARAFNTVGTLTLTIPRQFAPAWLRRNMRILLYRVGMDGYARLVGDTIWLLRRVIYRPEDETVQLYGEDLLSLLTGRIVAYTGQTPYADKTLDEFNIAVPIEVTTDDRLRLDNMLLAYARENFGALALDLDRDASDVILIDPDRSLAPRGEKEAAWATLLQVFQDLARMSDEKGTPLYFDFVGTDSAHLLFKVWTDYRTADRGLASSSPVVFSQKLGNLTDIEVVWDYSEEGNVCYVLGGDSGSARQNVKVVNEESLRADPFNRREFTIDLGNEELTESYMTEEGRAALAGRRARLSLGGRIVERPGAVYGTDFFYGDRVVAEADGHQFDCHINAVRGSYRDGKEELELRLAGERAIPS